MTRHLIDRLCNRVQGQTERSEETLLPLPTNYFTSVLDAQDSVPERTRTSLPGYTHVSSLLEGQCPRQYAILVREDRPLFRRVTGGHRVMWNIGRGVEKHVRQQYIKGRAFREVFGRWHCPCGESERTGMYAADARCGTCAKPLNHYGEYTVFDHDAKIVGNPDLIVRERQHYVIVEIKSMTSKQWEALNAPLGDHIFQAGMYRYLMDLAGFPMHPQVVILYCTKDFKWGSPYKEFSPDVTTLHRVQDFENARQRAREMAQHTQNGTLPPRLLCRTTTCKAAQSCPTLATCFNSGE